MGRLGILLGFLAGFGFATADQPITITVLHTNDLHAHVEGAVISKLAYGGYARQATLIKRFRATDPNVLLLSAGDTFQGTMFFNVYDGLADVAMLNTMGYQAACLGNHEFDNGPATLANFVKAADFPIVCANLDFSSEPALNGLVQPSTVLKVGGERVGIVGGITPDVINISSPGPNVKLLDLTSSIQMSVDELRRQGINKIIVLTHVGYDDEKQLVSHLHGVQLLVGGHSHTPLGTPALPGWPNAVGPYPTVVKNADGQDVYVVQSWEWGKVLGRFKVSFDGAGHVVKVFDAKPIVIDKSIPEDPTVKSEITAFEKPLLAQMNSVIGQTSVEIGRGGPESLMADVIADSMLDATRQAGAVAAFVNSGGVRADLQPGKITYGQAISVQPFNNTLTVLTLSGDELKRALEEGVATAGKMGGLLNPSKGTSYRLDLSQPAGGRVSNVVVDGQPLDPAKSYPICFLNFTSNGGDAHDVLKNSTGKRLDTGLLDIDALIAYIKKNSPLSPKPEGRLNRPSGGEG